MNFVMLTIISTFLYMETTAENGCKFSLSKDTSIKPLLLTHKGIPEFVYPDKFNLITMNEGNKIKLHCVDKKFTKFNAKILIATCVKGNIVRVRKREMQLKELECDGFPYSVVRKTNLRCQNNDTIIMEIGFKLPHTFLKTMSVCFNIRQEHVLYSWYNNTMLHKGHVSRVPRPNFVSDDLYSFNVTGVYYSRYQQEVLTRILKSEKLATKYVKKDGQNHLSRGHLTPKADYVYGSEQASTFHYSNVGPQWQIFNGGNWGTVEAVVRDIITSDNNSLAYGITTGTYGVMTLPDSKNVQREIYLHTDKNGVDFLPVPKFFWKTIYHKVNRTGITLIGINNPHLEKISKDYILCNRNKRVCKGILSRIKNKNIIKSGYVYCCTMRDFFKATGYKNVFEWHQN